VLHGISTGLGAIPDVTNNSYGLQQENEPEFTRS